MRVTSSMVYQQVLGDLRRAQTRLAQLQEQMASGRRINRPSDDPSGVQYTLDLSHGVAQNERYLANAQAAQDRLDTTDQALSSIGDLITRARQLAIQGSDSSLPLSAHRALAAEVRQLRDQLVDTANTEMAGHYLFAGARDDTKPWSVDPVTGLLQYANAAYPQTIVREIGPGVRVPVNVDASKDIQDLYTALDKLAQDLDAQDVTSVSGADLTEISRLQDAFLQHRAVVGALSARMQMAIDRLGAAGFELQKLLSDTEDADVTKTVMDALQSENAYRMALQVGARLLQPTLLDFLR
ncbi:MAG: flagellar hook-associated protein FlgL [Firmicutes bacterium]|nr:flagellar hook-associated protein FlgL [Bacillota bacterium]